MTIFRSRPNYIKGRKQSPVRTALWYSFAVVALIAMLIGPPYLARGLYDTASPSGDQIRSARAIIGAAILAPFAILFAWMWWQSRGAEAAWIKRREGARLDDPSKRSQKDEQ